jgi:hypothetical protein
MQEINAWLLSEQDFFKGVALYIEHGSNTFFKDLLKSAGPTLYNIQKLCAELTKLAPTSPAITEDPTETTQLTTQHVAQPKSESQLPKPTNGHDHSRYLKLLTRRDEIVRQLDRNMAALDFSTDKNALHQTAKQILRLHQTKQELWAMIDHYQQHGSFEPVEFKEPPSREKKMQLIYQSICKARKRLADPNYDDRKKTQLLIDSKLKELEELKGGTE